MGRRLLTKRVHVGNTSTFVAGIELLRKPPLTERDVSLHRLVVELFDDIHLTRHLNSLFIKFL